MKVCDLMEALSKSDSNKEVKIFHWEGQSDPVYHDFVDTYNDQQSFKICIRVNEWKPR